MLAPSPILHTATRPSWPTVSLSSLQEQRSFSYVNQDRELSHAYVKNAEKQGIKALFITVDAPQLGRREKDMRMKNAADSNDNAGTKIQAGQNVNNNEGHTRSISSFIDPSLNWGDIKWFQSITKMPIILKGVATWEDALLAVEAGVQGVVLSNHSGRQLDIARSGLEILVEVVDEFKKRGLWPNPNFRIFVDGGVRRASDVLKGAQQRPEAGFGACWTPPCKHPNSVFRLGTCASGFPVTQWERSDGFRDILNFPPLLAPMGAPTSATGASSSRLSGPGTHASFASRYSRTLPANGQHSHVFGATSSGHYRQNSAHTSALRSLPRPPTASGLFAAGSSSHAGASATFPTKRSSPKQDRRR
ncbi:hypothetical protein M0805_001964 [Coniferiporia weirii]|nr:hypothetical protein M0805_001964 [Coniferiporia weirii]